MLIMLNFIEELVIIIIIIIHEFHSDASFETELQGHGRLLYHRVLELMGGLVDKIHISCCAVGTRRFVAHGAC